jgi:hypothetical protein
MPTTEYSNSVNETFRDLTKLYKIPVRIPHRLFDGLLEENDLVITMLEHIDYVLKLTGKKSPYGYAAYKLSQLTQPLSSLNNEWTKINGVGDVTISIVKEILNTGTSSYYYKLLH